MDLKHHKATPTIDSAIEAAEQIATRADAAKAREFTEWPTAYDKDSWMGSTYE